MTDRFNREQFQAWKDHRLTALFLAYLRDFQADLGRQWAAGNSMAQEAQQTAKILGELSALEWDDVAKFYGIEPPETQSAE